MRFVGKKLPGSRNEFTRDSIGLLLGTITARFRLMNMVISLLILVAIVGFVIWGNLPKRGPQAPIDPIEAAKEARDREIGFIVGMLGGDIAEAARVRYAVERLEAQTGRIATPHEVGIAAGIVTNTQ